MPTPTRLTRREFIKLSSATSLGIALSACGVAPTPTATLAPTNTPLPTNTPAPTLTPKPTDAPTATIAPTATKKPATEVNWKTQEFSDQKFETYLKEKGITKEAFAKQLQAENGNATYGSGPTYISVERARMVAVSHAQDGDLNLGILTFAYVKQMPDGSPNIIVKSTLLDVVDSHGAWSGVLLLKDGNLVRADSKKDLNVILDQTKSINVAVLVKIVPENVKNFLLARNPWKLPPTQIDPNLLLPWVGPGSAAEAFNLGKAPTLEGKNFEAFLDESSKLSLPGLYTHSVSLR